MYANDRDPLHSGPWAQYGHTGLSHTGDKTIPKDEKGHPIRHQFSRAVPTAQCMSCHMHQPNSFVNVTSRLPHVGLRERRRAAVAETAEVSDAGRGAVESLDHNPEGAAVRGLWTNIEFLERISTLNPQAEEHAVRGLSRPRLELHGRVQARQEGQFPRLDDRIVAPDDPDKFKKAVHLRDIHLERGMHCSIAISRATSMATGRCTASTERTSRSSARIATGGSIATPTSAPPVRSRRREERPPPRHDPVRTAPFLLVERNLYQRSMVNPGMQWVVRQVRDTVTPGHQHYNEKSHYAKTIQRGGSGWGNTSNVAHDEQDHLLRLPHSSWMTSCWLPSAAGAERAQHGQPLRRDGDAATRPYNPQVLRTDVFMLGVNSPIKGRKIAPVRSSSALTISSTNPQRQRIYIQQPPIAASGYSQAFNPHVPHTVRSKETQACSSCHISENNDNNAWLAQTYLQGTNFVNFVGRFAWVATGDDGFEAIAVTEWEEPQAVIGSYLHKLAYPDWYANHQKRRRSWPRGITTVRQDGAAPGRIPVRRERRQGLRGV